jgi:hypothetical protein
MLGRSQLESICSILLIKKKKLENQVFNLIDFYQGVGLCNVKLCAMYCQGKPTGKVWLRTCYCTVETMCLAHYGCEYSSGQSSLWVENIA